MSMSTPTPTKEVERRYEVTLTPADGPEDGRHPYPPRLVKLRYSLDEANALEPDSDEAIAEAFERAQRIERAQFITARDSVFEGHVRFKSAGLVDFLPRRPRPRRRKR